MNTGKLCAIAGAILLIGTPASAHRLDEYLQATTISVEKDHIRAQMRLTPGVAVFPQVFASIDTDKSGVISPAEQRAYAERVLGDLSLTVNKVRFPLHLTACQFAETREMKEGRGEIELEFDAAVPRLENRRKLTFANHHQSRIAAYLVNCLVPTDPAIHVTAQDRDYLQSSYQLDYVQDGGTLSAQPFRAQRESAWAWLGGVGSVTLLLFGQVASLWRQRTRAINRTG